MEKEKLIIRNFGPIKDVELDLSRFNILIGEQATGKSTVAKVLAVCRYFSYIVRSIDTNLHLDNFNAGLEIYGLSEHRKDSYIQYDCEHYSLVYQYWVDIPNTYDDPYTHEETEYNEDHFNIQLTANSEEFKSLLNELEKIKPKYEDTNEYSSPIWSISPSFFQNNVSRVMDNPFYFPTERGLQSVFELGQGSIPNLASFLYNYFVRVDGIISNFKNEVTIEPLDLVYKYSQRSGYIRKKGEKDFFNLRIAASGYQSTTPIVLVIKHYNDLRKKSKTFIIEEPELNLFPNAQDKLMQYLVETANKNGNRFLLTTHSPYTLTSINNMMYAYQVGQNYPEKASEVIDKKYWLNPDDVSAYRMMSDGTAKNIIDNELKQIDAGEIDEISRVINNEWDKLANIEYSKENEN